MAGEESETLTRALAAVRVMRGLRAHDVDVGTARLMGAVLWAGGTLSAVILVPLSPPTRAFGDAGWLVAVALQLASVLIVWRRLDRRRMVSLRELRVSAYLGLGVIVLLEWLAGGRTSPYHWLYALPVVFAAGVYTGRRLRIFLPVAVLAVCAPLLYHGWNREEAVDIVTQVLMFIALVAATRVLLGVLRAQRGALRRAQERAELMAREDTLTSLGNRRAFEEVLGVEIARARRAHAPLSVMIADLDGFKQVNDRLGHAHGDACLRSVAEAMTSHARAEDQCFRWGGDEFAVVLPGADAVESEAVVQRFTTAVADDCQNADGQPLNMTCAVAQLEERTSAAELVASADRALIELKAQRAAAR